MLVRTRSLATLLGVVLAGGSLAAPAVATPAVALPAVAAPAVASPAVALPDVGSPAATAPAVATPAVALPAVGSPAATAPAVATPDPPYPVQRGGAGLRMPTSYPYQPDLRVFPPNDRDATERNRHRQPRGPRAAPDGADGAERPGLDPGRGAVDGGPRPLPGHRDGAGAAAGDRPAGRVARGDPGASGPAARDPALRAGYKTPIWISANIHGNEWEGTDAAHAASSRTSRRRTTRPRGKPWRGHRLVLLASRSTPTAARHATRATSLGLDANRDMITLATPEARSFVRTAQARAAAVRGGLPRLHRRAPGGAVPARRTARTTSTTCSSRTATR